MEKCTAEAKTYTYFKAWDGQIFSKEEDCIKYENSPVNKAWRGVQGFLVKKTYEDSLFAPFDIGGENEAYVFQPANHQDVEALSTYVNFDAWGNPRKIYTLDDSYIGQFVIVFDPYTKKPWLVSEMIKELQANIEGIINSKDEDDDYDAE